MPPLWPRVRVEDEHPRKECFWDSFDNRLCVTMPQAHVGNVLALEPRERRDNSIEKWLATDNPDIRIGFCLLNKMFAGAEPNFQPHLPGGSGEHPPLGEIVSGN